MRYDVVFWGLLAATTGILCALKIAGLLHVSWLVVVMPILVPTACAAAVILAFAILAVLIIALPDDE